MNFWNRLGLGFPRLIALSVAHPINHPMLLSMKRLEILDFKQDPHTHLDLKLSLPSLRHLSVRGRYNSALNHFLIDHGHQLESCLFEEPPWSRPGLEETMFWSTVPNLRLFGMLADTTSPFEGPPRNYPLGHVRITGRLPDARRTHQFVEHFSRLCHVYIGTSKLQSLDEAKLVRSLKELGLAVTEIAESELIPVNPISREKVTFFTALVLGVAYVHLFIAK
ncbi:hypothetical protein FRC17_010654 [Serendipita sp. 399]|nr:hypothetical protein FRC17_010654 [Serendipita sp. 399]